MDWKHTVIFLGIAIPSVAILTRILGWYIEKFKEPSWRKKPADDDGIAKAARNVLESQGLIKEIDGKEWIVLKAEKPYSTYEEYKKALTGDVDLDEFLARCRAGVPENPKAKIAEAKRRLEAIRNRLNPSADLNPRPAGPTDHEKRRMGIPEDKRCHRCKGYGEVAPGGCVFSCGDCKGTGIIQNAP